LKSRVISFGSLASPLARNQTQAVIDRIQDSQPRLTCQLNIWDSPCSHAEKVNEPFVAASRGEMEFLEQQLLSEQARLVVVEAADMVLPLPEGIAVICVPDRATPFDAYLNRQGLIMDEMEPGSCIGVLSMRSRSQMRSLWPDISFRILRGGVDRAMETHMKQSQIDGLVLPAAVTEHLGIQGIVAEIFSPEFILPGPGQGTLVILGRDNDQEAQDLLLDLHSPDTAVELETEHAFCRRMISDQDLPVGALARVDRGKVEITGTTGPGTKRIAVDGKIHEAEAVGSGLADQILSRGESFADLLEADFPDGLPDETDEDVSLLEELPPDSEIRDRATDIGHGAKATADPADNHFDEDLDELENLKRLEDLAGIEDVPADKDEDDEDDDLNPYHDEI
jgi:hydroxymethylbilane synthase